MKPKNTNREISNHLGITVAQFKDSIRTGRVSPGKSTGRTPILIAEQEDKLEQYVCRDKTTRQISYLEISIYFFMCNVGQDAIHNALRRRGYLGYIALSKPRLTDEHKRQRLQWAERYLNFTINDWCRVV